ncbi:MAG: protein kinase domain-containing protein [Bryobacteraceae bacterium]
MLKQTVSHYRVIEKLGDGVIGAVYRAEDVRLDRQVALAFLPEELTGDSAAVERFQREARAAAAISHPNICTVYEIGEFNGSPFLAMELLEGETLEKRIGGKPIPADTWLDWAIQITDGLEAAHERGIVHRDLKSTNLFITKAGEAKILYFGMAKLRPQQKAIAAAASGNPQPVSQADVGAPLGTPAYIAPEPTRRDGLDLEADLFSLGMVFYEMAAGKPPFEAASAGRATADRLHASPEPVARLNPELPDSLERIITKALDKDPDRQYQTAADLRADLRRAQQEMDTGQMSRTRLSDLSHLRVKNQRLRGASWLFAIAVCLLVAAAVFLLARPIPPPRALSMSQITHDRLTKVVPFVTDGSQVYFNTGNYIFPEPYQVSAAGGESSPLSISPKNASLLDMSSDGLRLLVGSDEGPMNGQSPYGLDRLRLWMVPIVKGSPRPLNGLLVDDAAWSPDGRQLVYSNGNDIGIARSDGTYARKIATLAGTAFSPRWSPDGKKIRFTLGRQSYAVSKYSGAQIGGALWEISSEGQNPHALFPGWRDDQCCGNWTRDGRYFVFQATENNLSSIWAVREQVSLFRRAHHEPMQLTTVPMNTYGPVPSPNGQRLFVGGRQPRIEIIRYDTTSKAFSPLLAGISAEGLDFSQDGQWVTYVTYPEGTLWRSTVSGEQRLQLSAGPMHASLPRWSPDGKHIAFMGYEPGEAQRIFIVQPDGGAPKQVTNGPDNYDPAWSPDGKSLAFGCNPSQVSAELEIHILNLATGQSSAVPGSKGLYSPRWSPDGRYIAALSTDSRTLFLFDFQSNKWTQLATASFGYPSWSPDSKYIYFDTLGKGTAFFRLRLRDRKVQRLVDLGDVPRKMGTFGPWAGLALDSSPLLTRDASFDEIYALDWEAP